jgi:hypothetical protein
MAVDRESRQALLDVDQHYMVDLLHTRTHAND